MTLLGLLARSSASFLLYATSRPCLARFLLAFPAFLTDTTFGATATTLAAHTSAHLRHSTGATLPLLHVLVLAPALAPALASAPASALASTRASALAAAFAFALALATALAASLATAFGGGFLGATLSLPALAFDLLQ